MRPPKAASHEQSALGRRLLIALPILWGVFAVAWAIISTRYSTHLDLLPVPRLGSLSLSAVAFLLYVPPIVGLLAAFRAFRKEAPASRALQVTAWAFAALLVAAIALAVPALFHIVTE